MDLTRARSFDPVHDADVALTVPRDAFDLEPRTAAAREGRRGITVGALTSPGRQSPWNPPPMVRVGRTGNGTSTARAIRPSIPGRCVLEARQSPPGRCDPRLQE